MPTADDAIQLDAMTTAIAIAEGKLTDMQTELPVPKNGLYLSIILGSNLNLSLMNKNDKYRYKHEYEKFKMTVTYVLLVTIIISYFLPTRAIDAVCHFLMVWYYCTLTIRESILRINGSRIKGWWVTHHYISCVVSGILLTWKDGECYQQFRLQFIVFTIYIAFVQLMQYQYQSGCLRRLQALGQGHSMDITVEGFGSWMFKGLTFLLPFLTLGYIFQLYNAYTLIQIWFNFDCTGQWQVFALSILFFLIASGNIFTTMQVLWRKIRYQNTPVIQLELKSKYSSSLSKRDKSS